MLADFVVANLVLVLAPVIGRFVLLRLKPKRGY